MDLLRAAFQVQIHFFDAQGVVEISDMGIVEGDMAILPDAHENDIHFLFRQDGIVAGHQLPGISLAADVVHLPERQFVENGAAEEIAEPLRRIGGKADIFIHVEGMDAPPVDAAFPAQRAEKFVLRRRGGKDNAHLLLGREQLAKIRPGFRGGGFTHLLS